VAIGVAALAGFLVVAAQASPERGPLLTKCKDTYALCAQAECTVLNGVTYCRCDVRHGTSIGLTQRYDGKDVCDLMVEGKDRRCPGRPAFRAKSDLRQRPPPTSGVAVP
jgi:hypothetical protein